ncbi:MAG: CRISPR-associated protein Csx11, partial [Chloroflexota bacterium]|nr:CRISPR-associated protein Csx11 [Chloroflexota bacterium]
FIVRHHPEREDAGALPYLLRLIVLADQRDSGDDQHTAMGVPQRGNVYGATVFGYEASPIDISCLDDARREVWQALTKALQGNGDWGDRRDEFMHVLHEKLSLTRGKTQRAANDITLYQHSRAVATRFKAYLARDLVDATRRDQEKFRLLNVAWDAWHFSALVPRLSDAAGRRDMIEEFKESVRQLVELEYPMGNVVYHDDSTLVALVADLKVEAELRARIKELARDITGGEIVPVVQLSDATTRVTDIVAERRGAHQSNPPREIPPWAAKWTGRTGAAICPVCGHRPLQSNDDPHCGWCGEVRGRGARRRLERIGEMEEKERETVWTGEIADRNGRLALLVGRFSLDRWLNGDLLHTVLITSINGRAQAQEPGSHPYCSLIEALKACVKNSGTLSDHISIRTQVKALQGKLDHAQKQLENTRTNPQIPEHIRPQRIQEAQEKLSEVKAKTESELTFLRGGPLLIDSILTQHGKETDQRLHEIAKNRFPDWPIAEGYAAALARKNPSAARLLRVWETTEDFLMRAVPEAIEWREAQRLRFPLSDVPRSLRAGIYTVAMVNHDGKRREIEVFLSREQGQPPAMITINRLSAEEKTWLEQCVGGGHIQVLARETGRKEPHGDLLDIQAATEEPYLPYHVLSTSPEMLVAILPAEIAPQVAQHIQATYEREMGKVIGRLPLYLGLFFMDEHFPMFVALDATRRAVELSNQLGNETETWHVRQTPAIVPNTAGDQIYRLIVQPEPGSDGQERSTYILDIPFQLGNGEPDFYHPYFTVSQSAPRFPLKKRSTHLRTPVGDIVHVSELQANDQLRIYPNRFDFLFLDTVARRFDMRLDKETGRRPHPLFGPRHSPRPYLLEDLARMEQVWYWCRQSGMTTTQLYGIRDLLATRFEEWDMAEKEQTAAEWQSYENLVAQVLGKEFPIYAPESQEHKGLRQAMLDGLFFDCLELHLQILKEKGVQQ